MLLHARFPVVILLFGFSTLTVIFSQRSVDLSAEDSNALKILKEGHSGELDCEARGLSPPVIHWLYNDLLIEQSLIDHMAAGVIAPPEAPGAAEIGYKHFTISTLLIHDAKLSDSGVYSCVADTPLDRKSRSFNVTVQPSFEGKRFRKSLPSIPSTPVRIYLWTDQVFEGVGANTVLICRATQGTNKRLPTINWYIDDELVQNNTHGVTIHDTGDLEFISTDEHNLAIVRCEAVGDDGSTDNKEPFIYIYSSN